LGSKLCESELSVKVRRKHLIWNQSNLHIELSIQTATLSTKTSPGSAETSEQDGQHNTPNKQQNQVIIKMVNYMTIHSYLRTGSVACVAEATKKSTSHLAVRQVME